jgi:UDP-GlcNAc:undecaprenyl-phosphate/decaprenyl-phosphate GlcNAc-1-phosphate transferase
LNLELFATFAATSVLLLGFLSLLNPVAVAIKLVDHPDGERKQHTGAMPLMGGTALLLTFFTILVLTPLDTQAIGYPLDFWPTVGILLAVLVATHVFDDIYEITAVVRLAIDGAIGILLCTIALLQLDTLGFLFGPAETTLGRWAVPMTVFCFVAASNAFNMTDGIDSLCSGLGILSFATLIALLMDSGQPGAAGLVELSTLVIFALIPMYITNLGIFGSRLKSFLGDSGARLIGFMAAIALVYSAKMNYINPVIAYFPIAVPVCDCLILMAVRLADKRSPLSPDRLHLHHLLLDCGLSSDMTRYIILSIGMLLSVIGFLLQHYKAAEWKVSVVVVVSFWCFIGLRWALRKIARRSGGEEPAVTTNPGGV